MTTDSGWFGAGGDEQPDQRRTMSRARKDWRPPAPAPVPPPAWPALRDEEADMTSSYPIVTQIELDDPARRFLSKRRDRREIPKIKAHEVLVWRVGQRYVVDSRQLRDSDDVVVDASSVSVVNVRPGTEVQVPFKIDSKDASVFTVKVTFVCSVTEADVVVRNGQVHVADTLLAYLRGYQDLFTIGLKYPITAINDVRAEMAVQVKAYMVLRPPKIPGVAVGPSPTVQVETPEHVASYEEDARRHQIEMQRQAEAAALEQARQEAVLTKAARLNEAVAGDSRAALGISVVGGGMNSADHAERLLQLDAEQRQLEREDRIARETRQYAVADRDAEWGHEENRDRIAWGRERMLDQIAWQRAEIEKKYEAEREELRRRYAIEDRDAQWGHEDKKEQIAWQHAEAQSRREENRESVTRLLEAEEKYLEALAAAGHFDTHVEDIGAVMQRIRRMASAGLDMSEERSALAAGVERQPQSDTPEDDGGN